MRSSPPHPVELTSSPRTRAPCSLPHLQDALAIIKEYCRQLTQGKKLCDLEYRGPRLAAAAPSPSPAAKAAATAVGSASLQGGRRLGSLPARLAMTPGRRRRRIVLPLQSLSGPRSSSASSQTTATLTGGSSSQLGSDGPASSADADQHRPPEPREEREPSAFDFDLQAPTAATTLPPASAAGDAASAGGTATQEDVDVALWLDAPSSTVRSTYGQKQRLRASPVAGDEAAGPAPAPPQTPAPAPPGPLLTTPRTPAALMAIRGLDADDGDDLANILQFVQDDVRGSTSVRRPVWLNSDSHHGTSSQALSLSPSSLL